MDPENKKAVKLGLFITIGLTLFIIVVLAIGNINKTFTKTIQVTTVFNEVSGLQPGDNVWFSGVKVGTVKEIRFIPNALVEVTMKIESSSTEFIPKNVMAKISSDGLIGSKIIVLYGGSNNAGNLAAGDVILIENTYTTTDMLNMLQENNKNILAITNDFKIISKQIAEGDGSIGKLLRDDAMYDNINIAINTLRSAAQNTEALTSSINAFTTKLNTDSGLANDLVTDTTIFAGLQSSIDQLNEITQAALDVANNLKVTTEDINTNKTSPAGVLLHDTEAANSLKASISNLESSTEKLNESMEALQHNFLLRRYFKKQNEEAEDK